MQKIRLIFKSLVASVITTLTILAISFIQLLFSTYDPGIYTTYFGAIILEITEEHPDYDVFLNFSFDYAQLHPIWITVLLLGILYYGIAIIYVNYKRQQINKD